MADYNLSKMSDDQIHELTVNRAKRLLNDETEIIEAMGFVDERRIWEKMGYTSLCQYAIYECKLSEDQASNYSRVARKTQEMPKLKEAIQEGVLTVSVAKRIVRVITEDNQDLWIDKATHLKQRELDREVARENPKAAVRDSIKPVSGDWNEIRGGISEEAAEILRRVQDLESQRTRGACDFNQTLIAMGKAYLKQNDPVQKAERNLKKEKTNSSSALRRKIPSQIRHQVMFRDQGQCRFVGQFGRCPARRWLDVHHIKPYSEGGDHSLENLTTLCKYHHNYGHQRAGRHSLSR